MRRALECARGVRRHRSRGKVNNRGCLGRCGFRGLFAVRGIWRSQKVRGSPTAPIQTILTLWAICEMARGAREKRIYFFHPTLFFPFPPHSTSHSFSRYLSLFFFLSSSLSSSLFVPPLLSLTFSALCSAIFLLHKLIFCLRSSARSFSLGNFDKSSRRREKQAPFFQLRAAR